MRRSTQGKGHEGGNSRRETSSRRHFIQQIGAAGAALAATGVVGKSIVGAVAEAASEGERDAQRIASVAEARTSLKAAELKGGSSAGELAEVALAEASDPTGRRLNKLHSVTLPPPVTLVNSAPAASPALNENILIRMQQDLKRALQKPQEQRRWIMVIDQRKCIGCSACSVACKAENKLPPGVIYRPVIEQEIGTFPHVSRVFTPRPCMQCENPPCVPVCPVSATYKRSDGIVAIDYDVCIGCRYCVAACPYGARTFDFGINYTDRTPRKQPYEEKPALEYGRSWQRQPGVSPVGNVRKCQFCLHRLAEGMLPACTTTCVGAATYFGDGNDRESLVSELAGRGNVRRLKEELGTHPSVFYLM